MLYESLSPVLHFFDSQHGNADVAPVSSRADVICHRCGEPMYYAPRGNQFLLRKAMYCSVLVTPSPDGETCVWVCAEINSLNANDGPRPEWADPQPVIDRIDELVNESLDAGWQRMK